MGFANGTIRQWGRKNPGVNKVKDVAKYFNVSVDYLLGLDEDESTTQTVDLAELANKPKDFDWGSVLSVGGKPIPEEDKEIIRRLFAHKLSD
ncbi:XRE family transcriptional regulator [Lactococcus lactis]|nr:XRE family transcriptional regulator [Lactococcus lactis]